VVVEPRDGGAGLSEDDAAVSAASPLIRIEVEQLGARLTTDRVGAFNVARLSIALALASTPAPLVSAAGWRFVIPQTSLIELAQTTRDGGPQIENVAGGSPSRVSPARGSAAGRRPARRA